VPFWAGPVIDAVGLLAASTAWFGALVAVSAGGMLAASWANAGMNAAHALATARLIKVCLAFG
jgi:hypothetical protein